MVIKLSGTGGRLRKATRTQREIQSLEVSYFVHATEDEARVSSAVQDSLATESEGEREELEGHFGNRIISVRLHLSREEAWSSFRALVGRLGEANVATILGDLDTLLDEHGALYIRLSKQSLVKGEAVLGGEDVVRVRVKPRLYAFKGNPADLFARVMRTE